MGNALLLIEEEAELFGVLWIFETFTATENLGTEGFAIFSKAPSNKGV